MNETPVQLVTALPAEAKPVAGRFKLERVQGERPFPVYRNRHISLVVSGVGKLNAAAAGGYLYALNDSPRDAVWINVGIAGHRDLPVGGAVLAHRVTDSGTGHHWCPGLAFEPPCPMVALETMDQPEFDYTRDSVFDMEASGFFAAASRFSNAPLVQCLKVISDNRENPGRGISARTVSTLIGNKLDLLNDMIMCLGPPADRLRAQSSL